MWDNIQWSKICAIRVAEGGGRENETKGIIEDNGKELMKDTKPQIQEAQFRQEKEREREEQETPPNTLCLTVEKAKINS